MDSLGALQWTSCGRPEFASEAEPPGKSSLGGFAHHRLIGAMRSLPGQFHAVLWHVEVLGQTPDEIAMVLGMTDSEVTAALVQAREGLRRAYGR